MSKKNNYYFISINTCYTKYSRLNISNTLYGKKLFLVKINYTHYNKFDNQYKFIITKNLIIHKFVK